LNIFDNFIELIRTLEEEKVEYVLIGGFAIILHGFARATQDIDLFVNSTEENIRKLRSALKRLYKDNSIDEITISELYKYPVIRYGTDLGFCIDIIISIGEKFSYKDLETEIIALENCKVRIATPKTLYKLKKNTHREIDQLDIKFLKAKIKNAAN